MKRFSRAVAFIAIFLPTLAFAAKAPLKKNVKVSSAKPGKLEPFDWVVVDGLDYPVPRNINRRPAMPLAKSAKNSRAPAPEVYTAVDPTQ